MRRDRYRAAVVFDDRAVGAALERALEGATGSHARLTGVPVPLTGGFSARLFAFRLEDSPGALQGELVLRMPARGGNVRREGIIQREVAKNGYPAPAVLVLDDEPTNPLGRPYLVMPKEPGTPLFVDAGPIEVLKAFRRAPVVLAGLMADLHDLDPEPVVRALEAGGVAPDQLGERSMLDELRDAVDATEEPALTSIAAWLAANQPTLTTPAVCHGDLHALNVLDDASGRCTVIDWELATIGHPTLDVARTSLLLSAVPIEMPAPVRVVVQRLGRRSAARFQAAYATRRPLDAQALSWHEALHAGQILGRLLRRATESAPADDPVLDAWQPTAPFLRARLRQITGIDVAPASPS